MDWPWFPSLVLLQAWEDAIKTGLLRNTHRWHERISWAVEEPHTEDGAQSGAF